MNKSRKVASVSGAVVLAIAAIAGALEVSAHLKNRAQVSQAEAAAKAYREAGLPWVAADLRQGPPIKEEDNAAPLIEKAIDAFDKPGYDKAAYRLEELSYAGKSTEVMNLLRPYEKALDIAREAAAKPAVDFHRDWDLGPTIEFPEVPPLKNFVILLTERAEAEAKLGKSDECVQDLDTALKLGRFFAQEPTQIGLVLTESMYTAVARSLENVALSFQDQPQALEKLQGLSAATPAFDVRFYERGEAYAGLAALRNPFLDPTSAAPIDASRIRRTGLPTDSLALSFAPRYLGFWSKWAKETAGVHNPLDIDARGSKVHDKWEHDGWNKGWDALVASRYLGADSLGSEVTRDAAQRRCMAALLAALQVRAKTGKMPSSISEIPGTWIDPFTDRPLIVKRDGEAILIYAKESIDGFSFEPTRSKPGPSHCYATFPPLPRVAVK